MSAALYSTEQVRELDRSAIAAEGIAGYQLMQRAGCAVHSFIRRQYPGFCARPARILVVCGGGKNGGDGYVIARLLHRDGCKVELCPLIPLEKLQGDVLKAARDWRSCGGDELLQGRLDIGSYDLIIDAMLGTGLQRPVEGLFAEIIGLVNAARCPVIAVDIPSGLNADTGQPFPLAVMADHTITFIARKRGLYTGRAADYCGRIHLEDLQAPSGIYGSIRAPARLLEASGVLAALPRRRPSAHKGDNGHVLVVGGDTGMQGGAQMTGLAALRCGAGLTSIATRRSHAPVLSALHPELMSWPVERASALAPLLQRATVVALGPGLGRAAWGRQLFARSLATAHPLVVDADGLNWLAAKPATRSDWILTPHPGEAARLLGISAGDVQADRYAAVRALAARYRGVVVLKGAGTLIAMADDPVTWVCDRGHAGMASGGMGDVLTGIIAGLLAQGMTPFEAAKCGVWVHARAGERASAPSGGRGMLATDLLPELRRLLNHEVL
ncbi:MAG TPA: NAD(P)H-hydrate dehydratase [Gammaproteobacteria bacterium]|nr:NAD(P)H-hydrate dehydratase [Gammaproteobacteria bacterium]